MLLNNNSHPYLFTYGNQAENRDTTDNTYLHHADNTRDFWFCQFSNHTSFEKFPIRTLVPAEIIERVLRKEVYLIFDNSNECYNRSVDGIYKHVVIEGNIPECQIILVSGGPDVIHYVNYAAAMFQKEPIKVEWLSGLEVSVKNQLYDTNFFHGDLQSKTLIKKSYPKKYLNLNRRWRQHRPTLLALMYERKLLDYGYVSFGKADDNVTWNEAWYGVMHYFKQFNNDEFTRRLTEGYEVHKVLPLYLDTTDLVTNRDFIEDSINPFFENTYFSVVSETTFNTKPFITRDYTEIPDGRFLTEKIYKTIAAGHPMIVVAPPRTLEALRSLEYKTFSPIINEAYDLEQDDCKRLMMITDEIERLCKLSEAELNHFLYAAKEICDYNFSVLVNKEIFIKRMNF